MADHPDWFMRSRDLGIPSTLAHDTYQQDGIDGLRTLCEGWARERVILPAEIQPLETDGPVEGLATEEETHDDEQLH